MVPKSRAYNNTPVVLYKIIMGRILIILCVFGASVLLTEAARSYGAKGKRGNYCKYDYDCGKHQRCGHGRCTSYRFGHKFGHTFEHHYRACTPCQKRNFKTHECHYACDSYTQFCDGYGCRCNYGLVNKHGVCVSRKHDPYRSSRKHAPYQGKHGSYPYHGKHGPYRNRGKDCYHGKC